MGRAGLLVALGVGVMGASDASSLLPFALVVAAAFAVPNWLRQGKKPSRVQLPARIPSQPVHYHYCDACDQQWRHERTDCIAHWACHCPVCTAVRTRPGVSNE